jgi:hypothetical protein
MKPVKPSIGFNMKGLIETIVVAPGMVEYVIEMLEQLEEESGLPLTRYNILPSLYCAEDQGLIFDDESTLHIIRFSFNAEDFLLGDEEEE